MGKEIDEKIIHLRRAEEIDQAFLSKVCLDTHKLYAPFMGNLFIKQAHRYEDSLPSGHPIYIIEVDKVPIGYVGYKRKEDAVMYVVSFYLLEAYCHKGYGQKIMEILEATFYERGMEKVVLEVHQKAYWARDFYTKQGFVRALGQDEYKNDPRDKEMILLCKILTEYQDVNKVENMCAAY